MAKEYLIGDFLKRIKRPIDLEPNQDYNLVTIKMNHKGVVLRGKKKGCDIKSKMFKVKEGDFILSGIDARNGAFGIVGKELEGAIVTNDFWYFEIDDKIISKQLFLELTATNWFDDICQKGSDGTTQRIRLQKDKFFNQKILLPEGEEQKELLNKILTFKKGKSKLNTEINAQKHLLSQLKQSILQEAIQGKLTADWRKQNPTTETASELLKRIKAEKAQLIKEKKIKKEKPLPPITKEEIPFELPEGWVWTRFQNITSVITCGIASTPKYYSSGRIFLSAKNVKPFKFMPENHKFINEETYQKIITNSKPEINDILITRVGAGIGETALIDKEIDFAFYVSLTLVKPISLIDSKFLVNWLNSPKGIQTAISFTSGNGSNQGNLNVGRVRNFVIPLPPISEQKEIVKKVETLMQNCQQLEQEIKTSEANAQMLMQAVLKESFEGGE